MICTNPKMSRLTLGHTHCLYSGFDSGALHCALADYIFPPEILHISNSNTARIYIGIALWCVRKANLDSLIKAWPMSLKLKVIN